MKMIRWMLGSFVVAGLALAAFALFDASLAQGHGGAAAGHKGADHSSCLAGAGISPCRKEKFFPGVHKKRDTYWMDTDGEHPDRAGCHIELVSDKSHAPLPGGRTFGEVCETPTILIESNPGAFVIHTHTQDYGAPYRVDCNKWCQFAKRGKSGACKATDVSGSHKGVRFACKSAHCVCSN